MVRLAWVLKKQQQLQPVKGDGELLRNWHLHALFFPCLCQLSPCICIPFPSFIHRQVTRNVFCILSEGGAVPVAFVVPMPPEIAATCPRLPAFFKVCLITEKYAKTASTQNQLFIRPVKYIATFQKHRSPPACTLCGCLLLWSEKPSCLVAFYPHFS